MPDGVETGKLGKEIVHHGCGQGGNRARAARHQHPGQMCGGIQLADASHEITAVRQIEVIASRIDTRLCNTVILLLEWSGGMDNGIDLECIQLARERSHFGIQRNSLPLGQADLGSETTRFLFVTAGDQKPDIGILHQRTADISTEVAVTPEHQNSMQPRSLRVFIISRPATRRARRPWQPKSSSQHKHAARAIRLFRG